MTTRVHSDKVKEYQRRYRETHREYYRNYDRLRLLRTGQRRQKIEVRLLYAAKYRAKAKNLEFDLIVEYIQIPEFCPILGIKLQDNSMTGSVKGNSPSIDRIDDSRGYTKDNIAVISHKANACKSNLSTDDIKRLYEYVTKQ